jgi:MFS family permease
VALLGVAVGAVITMPLAGRLVARFGSRPVTRLAAVAFAASLALPALAPNLVLLTLALIVLGAGNGALDVAMNAQAATVERGYGRPVMSGFHALFSLGGLAGAAFGGVIAGLAVRPAVHLAFIATMAGALAWWVTRFLLSATSDAARGDVSFRRPSRTLLALGVVAFCVLIGEGAMADWTAVYLRDVAGASPALAAAGYAAFSLAMASGRIVGDALTVRFGAPRLVRCGGLLAAAGVAVGLTLGKPWTAILGFGLVGAGLSVIFPTVLAAASRLPDSAPGHSIAVISTFGYAGFLVGPPLIGLVAHASSLRIGLLVLVVTSLLVALLAGAIRRSGGGPHHAEAGDAARSALAA